MGGKAGRHGRRRAPDRNAPRVAGGKTEVIAAREAALEAEGGVANSRLGNYFSRLYNAMSGARNERAIEFWLRARYGEANVVTQVKMFARGADGMVDRSRYAIVDFVVRDPANQEILLYDAKTTTTAGRSNTQQREIFEDVRRNGGSFRTGKNVPDWMPVDEAFERRPVTELYRASPDLKEIKDAVRGTRPAPSVTDVAPKAATEFRRHPRLARAARRLRPLRKLKLGFGAKTLLSIATSALMGALGRRLERVNRAQIAMLYRDAVFGPLVHGPLTSMVAEIRAGTFFDGRPELSRGHHVYLAHAYAVEMNLEAHDLADVVVFFAQELRFSETVRGVHATSQGLIGLYAQRPRLRSTMRAGRVRTTGKNVVTHYHTQFTPVWDPVAHRAYRKIHGARDRLLPQVSAVAREAGTALDVGLEPSLIDLVRRLRFLELQRLAAARARTGGRHAAAWRALATHAGEADQYVGSTEKWPADRRGLLALYLEADLYSYRWRIFAAEAEERQRQNWRNIGDSFLGRARSSG